MNIFLWILQGFLALHTLVGAVWKFSSPPEQTMASFKAIPPGVWLSMSILEILCGLGLVVPALAKPLAILTPIAAILIALEMLAFTGLHLSAGDGGFGPIIYWLVVAGICGFIVYGRLVLQPYQ